MTVDIINILTIVQDGNITESERKVLIAIVQKYISNNK